MRNLFVVFYSVAALDVLFAAALRLGGPLESSALNVGLCVVTVFGAIGALLAVRSRARGPWVVAIIAPAAIAAAWSIGMCFALGGSMHFVRWAGLWTRGTDTAWLGRLTLIGGAIGIVFGIVLALGMRGRAWTLGMAALVGACCIPILGIPGAVLAASAQLFLGAVALLDARDMRVAEAKWRHGSQLREVHDGPYRTTETEPLDRLRALFDDARIRAWGATTTMLLATAIAIVSLSRA
jgi:hypothetical protein